MHDRRYALLAWAWLALIACDDGNTPPPTVREPGHSPPPSGHGGTGAPNVRDASVDRDAAVDSGRTDAAQDEDAGLDPALCGQGACDLLDPGGCAATDGCVFAMSSDTDGGEPSAQCIQVGTGRDGDRCSSYADCSAGLDCTTADEGACRRYCCELNTTRGCPSGQFCSIAIEDARGASSGVFLCDRCDGCDVRDPDGCGEGLGCYLLPGPDPCNACLPRGELEPGGACTFSNDCVPGSTCVGAPGERSCRAFCDLNAADCAAGQRCRAVNGGSLPAGTGLCLEPS
jgi:hypothetical protein